MDADYDSTAKITQEALEAGVEYDVLMKGISEVISEMEEKEFKDYKVWMHPIFFMAMEAARRSLAILEPLIEKEGKFLGTVVLGVPEGDVHDVGAKMLMQALTAAGFKVVYLGRDVSPSLFVNKVLESNAQILMISIYVASSLKRVEEILELLSEVRIRDKVKIMVGGVSVTEKFADKLNLGYARSASNAVRMALNYIEGGI
ncbi:MAG: cobalamin-dependent protein [Deltaproteobacteria bacterium]|nr:cobalamin-dependent protein [Deltaproteobacteria bacterium]